MLRVLVFYACLTFLCATSHCLVPGVYDENVYSGTGGLGEPPLGPRNAARCPVTGVNITVGNSTPTVHFKHGQSLYFSSHDAADKYRASPRDYWLSPHELPLSGLDGKRGLPDLRNETLQCPMSGESMLISMATPRVVHRHGQNVYFCCFGCVAGFWTDPASCLA